MNPAERHTKTPIRTFIAVKVSPDKAAMELLKEIRNALKDENIVWNRIENFHITVLFIGETPLEMIQSIQQPLEKLAERTERFRFKISGLGVFRTINHPRVLWLGCRDTEQLFNLKKFTDEGLLPLLKLNQSENFKPHLTIGRMRKIQDLKLLGEILKKYENQDFLRVKADEIIFYESISTPEGPVYKLISAHPFKNQMP